MLELMLLNQVYDFSCLNLTVKINIIVILLIF